MVLVFICSASAAGDGIDALSSGSGDPALDNIGNSGACPIIPAMECESARTTSRYNARSNAVRCVAVKSGASCAPPSC